MNFEEIKQIVEADGGKFIIVESGKPTLVVSSFEDYKSRIKLNKKDNPGKTQSQERVLPKELRDENLKIEDLPL